MSTKARAKPNCHAVLRRRGRPMAAWSRRLWRDSAVLAGSCVFGMLLWGCTGSSADDENVQPAPQHTVPSEVAQLPDYASLGPEDDPRQLSFGDLNNGPGTQELGASKLLTGVGVMEMLESYIINVPPSARFVAGWDANKASVSNVYRFADAGADGEIMDYFESSMLRFAQHAMSTVPYSAFSPTLHDAFFEVLEACGRASAWPEVELFVLHQGRGGNIDVGLIEPRFGLTYFEYQQLLHQCARYAATYPTLDPAVRDKLLKAQREHYAKVILDRLDNELPVVEVPPEYQAEIEELRRNGW